MRNSYDLKLFLIYFALLATLASGQNVRDKEKQVKDQILDKPYDPTILPKGENVTGPVNVNVSLELNNILSIDDSAQTVEMQILLKLAWNEPRFTYTLFPPKLGPHKISIAQSLLDKTWIPDYYIVNAERVEYGQKLFRVYPNGDVKFSVLTKVRTLCPMDLGYFPHDRQTCDIQISSFAFTDVEIKFKWKETNPIQIPANIMVPRFELLEHKTDTCDLEIVTETYSCVKLELSLQRQFNSYLIKVYIPCSMLIIISWLSYWLHPLKSATARLLTSFGALGLAIIGAGALNNSLPSVSYTKAIDVWSGVSLTIIFLSLIEFVIVNYLNQYGHGSCKSRGKKPAGADSSENAEQQTPLNPSGEDKSSSQVLTSGGCSNLGSTIDIIFRIAIPIFFLVFIIIYWIFLVIFLD